jgi:hypothetical protein
MAGLSFGADADWMVSRWIFRQLLESARSEVARDSDLDHWLQVGIANDMLALDLIDPIVGSEFVSTLRAAAERQLGDQLGYAQLSADDEVVYMQALRTLLAMLDAQA